ncbi:hypothetical protein FQN53_007688 [Emmonsiellopsis sp. PD_33]|nr:hypothetical protein FQN53_007688 [Emmonsiellopsis sp. PD_33]
MNGLPGAGRPLRPGDMEPIPYTPITSMGRELGIMFGFIGLSVLTMAGYWYFWQAAQRRNAAKEAARIEELNERARLREAEKRNRESGSNDGEQDGIGRAQDLSITAGVPTSRTTRNGTSTNGFGFGDTTQGLIV